MALDLMEFSAMLDALKIADTRRREETAYWISCIMNCFVKKAVKPSDLLRPFEPPKSSAEIMAEREEFFQNFTKQRKEAQHGNSSTAFDKNWR